MKKLVLIAVVTVFFLSQAQSQNTIGIKGGLDLSDFMAKGAGKTDIRVGYLGGIYARLGLVGPLGIQTEALYVTKGSCMQYDNGQINGRANFNLNYIDIPLLAVLNITDRYHIHAGPYFGILTNVMIKNESTDSESFDFESAISRDNFRKTDFGVAAGVEADFKRAGLGVRYNLGLRNVGIEQTISGEQLRIPDATNSLLQVYLTVRIL